MKIEHLTFTGTQNGMTLEQFIAVAENLAALGPETVHHGGCIGADEQLHWLIVNFFPAIQVHVHKGDNPKKQAVLAYRPTDLVTSAKPNLTRNRDMVEVSGWVLGAPAGEERLRSGTWATLRYADDLLRQQVIVYPNGTVQERVYG